MVRLGTLTGPAPLGDGCGADYKPYDPSVPLPPNRFTHAIIESDNPELKAYAQGQSIPAKALSLPAKVRRSVAFPCQVELFVGDYIEIFKSPDESLTVVVKRARKHLHLVEAQWRYDLIDGEYVPRQEHRRA